MSSPIPPEAIFSVAEFLDLTNELLKPLRVTVQGEITSLTHRGTASYFNLSDKHEKAVLNCMIWRHKLNSLGVDLKEGLEIQVIGVPNIYKPFGKFSFQADYISPVGEGALKQAFEKLKRKLEQAGFFAQSAKQNIPEYPTRIGLITSSQGDAIKDFRTHLGQFGYQIFHYDVRVEGLQAVDSISRAFKWFNEHPLDLDVIVLTRGGGSLESLQAFNSEPVAKAIFSSKIPVISAIGHENDITISDLVADVRASTPTDAGKIISANWARLEDRLKSYQETMTATQKRALIVAQSEVKELASELVYLFSSRLEAQHQALNFYQQSLSTFLPRLKQRYLHLTENFKLNYSLWNRQSRQLSSSLLSYEQSMPVVWQRWINNWETQLTNLDTQLNLSDPTLKLKQGYSIVMNEKSEVIRSVNQVKTGDQLNIKLHQGKLGTKVERVEAHESKTS